MRSGELWSSLAAISWVAGLVGSTAHAGSELESGRYVPGDERIISDTYTVANINITYEDEHGEVYTETSEVSFTMEFFLIYAIMLFLSVGLIRHILFLRVCLLRPARQIK